MTKIEAEVDLSIEEQDCLSTDNYCFICLNPVSQFNKGQTNSLNLFCNYLKIIYETENAFVCEKCKEKLIKFKKLYNDLEKVRLEMDYLLGFIQSSISNSNQELDPAYLGFRSVRESVVKKCQEKIHNPKPVIVLQRIDYSKFIKHQSQSPGPDYSDDWSVNFSDDDTSDSSYSPFESSAPPSPVIIKIRHIKREKSIKRPTTKDEKRPTSSTTAKCPKCSKIFGSKSTLKQHIDEVHHRQRPFKCSKCSKTFSRKRDLGRHINSVHLCLKPFKCSTCNHEFSQKDHLRQHIDIVHLKLKPFECDICGKSFTRKNFLRDHKIKSHDQKVQI